MPRKEILTAKPEKPEGKVKLIDENFEKETDEYSDLDAITIYKDEGKTVTHFGFINSKLGFHKTEYFKAQSKDETRDGYVKADNVYDWKTQSRALYVKLEAQTKPGIDGEIGEVTQKIERHISEVFKAQQNDPVAIKYRQQWVRYIEEILPGVVRQLEIDKPILESSGLIERDENLDRIGFSFSDFHKGGKQVLFLFFEQGSKIVFKPGSLQLDKLLFGAPLNEEDESQSFARLLNPNEDLIPTYKIISIPLSTSDKTLEYGYMEFIEEEFPANNDDLRNIIKSIAANMAMSFIFGFSDGHFENMIIRKNKIQMIDMEAVVGGVKMSHWVDEQLWRFALTDLVESLGNKKSIGLRIHDHLDPTVIADDALNNIETECIDTFLQIFNNGAGQIEQENSLLEKLNGIIARLVPLSTSDFNKDIAKIANENLSEEKFNRFSLAEGYKAGFYLSPATYKALFQINIPYYYNKLGVGLGPGKITDEEDNSIEIDIESAALINITGRISEEILGRLQMPEQEVLLSFWEKTRDIIPRLKTRIYEGDR